MRSIIWLCPRCEATITQTTLSSCMLCDDYGFITELEMAVYEGRSLKKTFSDVLTLDLSEFEQERTGTIS